MRSILFKSTEIIYVFSINNLNLNLSINHIILFIFQLKKEQKYYTFNVISVE